MDEIPRIDVVEAHAKAVAGEALLVCAYEDELKYAAMRLEGSISLQEFREKRQKLAKDAEIIFFCA